MDTSDASIRWWQLVALMAVGDGTDVAVHGVARVDSQRPDGGTNEVRLWSCGPLLRREDRAGRPRLVAGSEKVWIWDGDDGVPVELARGSVSWGGDDTLLTSRRTIVDYAGDDCTRPRAAPAATTFLGRAAWEVELAPPAHKTGSLTVVADAETGMVLSARHEGGGGVAWLEVQLGADLPPELFTWDGPVRASPALMSMETRRRGAAWLAERGVTFPALQAEPIADVRWFDDDGSFSVFLEHMAAVRLARRPHSDEPWDDALLPEASHWWTTGAWDWALLASSPGEAERVERAVRAHDPLTREGPERS